MPNNFQPGSARVTKDAVFINGEKVPGTLVSRITADMDALHGPNGEQLHIVHIAVAVDQVVADPGLPVHKLDGNRRQIDMVAPEQPPLFEIDNLERELANIPARRYGD